MQECIGVTLQTLTNVDGRPQNADDYPKPMSRFNRGDPCGHGESWVALANQMDGLADGDPVNAAHLALAR